MPGEPKPPIADTGATQDIASYRSIKNQCDLIDFLRITTHHGSLKNVKSTAGAAPAPGPALKHAYILPHSRSHGHLPWINALSTTNSSSPRPSPESARRRRSSGSPLPHLVLKPTPGAQHPHQHHTITKTEPIRHHPPLPPSRHRGRVGGTTPLPPLRKEVATSCTKSNNTTAKTNRLPIAPPVRGTSAGAFECGGSHATMGARGARVNVSRDAHQSRTLLARRARSHPRGAVATSGPRSARPGRGGSRVDRRRRPATGRRLTAAGIV